MTHESSDDPASSGSLPIESVAAVRRILIIEDNDELRRQLVDVFTERGWQVEAARTLHSALAIAARQLPHVIVTELRLPDVRGYFADQIRRAVSGDVAIVAVTRISQMIFESARKAGFDDVFGKPVNLDALHDRIDAVLATYSVRS